MLRVRKWRGTLEQSSLSPFCGTHPIVVRLNSIGLHTHDYGAVLAQPNKPCHGVLGPFLMFVRR